MHENDIRSAAARYITDRACPSGGFCHYRLDEPNLHDTWHALAGLRILDARHDSAATLRFLRSFQAGDGSYTPIGQAFYAILGLNMMGVEPLHSPAGFITRSAKRPWPGPGQAGAAAVPMLDELSRVIVLHKHCGVPVEGGDNIRRAVIRLKNRDGGFGSPASSLTETLAAVEIMLNLGLRADAEGAAQFVRSCEHPVTGFTDMPGTSLHYIEHVHAGLALCQALRIQPGYASACAASVKRCQLANGGFSRASLGIANLEYTYLALRSLQILADFQAEWI
jgi:hypothetical protein